MKLNLLNGYCHCGCGYKTLIASRSDSRKKWVKGEPKKYIYHHKLPPSFKDRERTTQDRMNKSIAAKKRVLSGKNNFYKGGISTKCTAIKNSFEYKTWQRYVFKRDGWKCVMCGAKSGWHKESHSRTIIHADHIKPKARFPELMFDVNNGRTLCINCHINTDTWGGRTTFYGK